MNEDARTAPTEPTEPTQPLQSSRPSGPGPTTAPTEPVPAAAGELLDAAEPSPPTRPVDTGSAPMTVAVAERRSLLQDARHPVNVGHLVMGVAFLGLAAVWVLIVTDTVEGADIRWLMPLPWVAAGLAGIAAGVLSARRRTPVRSKGWVGEPGGAPGPDDH